MTKVKVVKEKEDRENLDWFLMKAQVPRQPKLTPMMKRLTVSKKRLAGHC